MATTVDDLARATLAAVGSNAGVLQAIRWTSDRYRQLSNRGRLRALRRVEQLVIPASIDDGTVTVTRGSTTVTGDATAIAAWVAAGTDALRGRYFRFRRNWYKITNFSGSTISLHSEITEDDSSAVGYKIVQRHTRLPKDLKYLGNFVHQRLWRPLAKVNLVELDQMHPERLFVTGTGPEMYAEVGDDEDGVRLVEFYPYPNNTDSVLFTYFAKSPDLTPGMALPDDLDIEALKQGVLIDVYRFEMARAARENRVEQAALWRNELRAQETTWEKRIEELLHSDRSSDDLSVILHTMGPPAYGDLTFIRTARQDAVSRLDNWP